MGIGKIAVGAVLGIGAVALAPFTGGGSLLTVGLGSSLAGAGVTAALAAFSGGLLGKFLSKEPQEQAPRKQGLSFIKIIELIGVVLGIIATLKSIFW